MSDASAPPWLIITGGDVVLPGGDVLPGGCVTLHHGIIRDVLASEPDQDYFDGEAVVEADASGCWVTPGLIDQHMHGAFGVDFNQGTVPEIHQLLHILPRYGITGVLPTVMTAPKLDMVLGLTRLEEAVRTQRHNQARILGLHMEGPFLHPDFRGAHPASDLLRPSPETLTGMLSPSLKRMTLAPELDEGLETIRALTAQGISCSLGHSSADYNTTLNAVAAGATCITHLFNAMARLDHRKPSIAMAALNHDDLYTELITDGQHLAVPTIQMVLKQKPFDRTIVISDCNALTGQAQGAKITFGKSEVVSGPDGALNAEGKLAGSTTLIGDCMRNLVHWGLLTFPQAVQMATLHPARHLGQDRFVGQLIPGAMGDIVAWDKTSLELRAVFLGGQALPLDVDIPITDIVF